MFRTTVSGEALAKDRTRRGIRIRVQNSPGWRAHRRAKLWILKLRANLSGAAVLVVQTAEMGESDYLALPLILDPPRLRRLFSQREVRPGGVVVDEVGAKEPL